MKVDEDVDTMQTTFHSLAPEYGKKIAIAGDVGQRKGFVIWFLF